MHGIIVVLSLLEGSIMHVGGEGSYRLTTDGERRGVSKILPRRGTKKKKMMSLVDAFCRTRAIVGFAKMSIGLCSNRTQSQRVVHVVLFCVSLHQAYG
jgi:hypothetical protein